MAEEQQRPTKGLMDEDGRGRDAVVLGEHEESSRMHASMLVKVGPAMLVVVLCLVAVYAVPALQPYRPWSEGDPAPFWNLTERPWQDPEVVAQTAARVEKVDTIAREALAETPEPVIVPQREVVVPEPGDGLPPYEPHPEDQKAVEQSIEVFAGTELDRFFGALARSDAALQGATTRAVHWGDSAIGVDGITSAIRTRLQARFGDGGHGFHVVAPPNTSYRHRGIKFRHNDKWSLCFIIQKCRGDGHYGLGGTTARSLGGAQSTFAPSTSGSSGHVSRFEVWYAAWPRGGKLKISVDDEDPVILETAAEQLQDRFHTIEVPDGPHRLKVRAGGGGRTRVYGVALERDAPGVVWDGLALVGAFTRRMLEFDREHLRTQLEHRRPHLAVFTFGGNDMIRSIPMETYADEYRKVIRMVREARPDMDCMVMAPLDHGERKGVRIVSREIVPLMVQAQRGVAESEGCAFFDTHAAMGGEGAAGRWFRQTPRLVSGDLSHVTYKGQIVVGEMFYRALVQAYVAYRRRPEAATP